MEAYLRAHVSFVRIHPFFDGNGRLARLLANLPVLYAGHVPIVVPKEGRADYIRALWTYQCHKMNKALVMFGGLLATLGVKAVDCDVTHNPSIVMPTVLADFDGICRHGWRIR